MLNIRRYLLKMSVLNLLSSLKNRFLFPALSKSLKFCLICLAFLHKNTPIQKTRHILEPIPYLWNMRKKLLLEKEEVDIHENELMQELHDIVSFANHTISSAEDAFTAIDTYILQAPPRSFKDIVIKAQVMECHIDPSSESVPAEIVHMHAASLRALGECA